MRYFDTAILLKLYLPEKESHLAEQRFNEVGKGVVFTELHRTEMISVILRHLREKNIDEQQCGGVLADIEADIADGVFVMPSVQWDDVFACAQRIATENPHVPCRTLDLLHVAVALSLNATELCSTDKKQIGMAVAAGLQIIPLEF